MAGRVASRRGATGLSRVATNRHAERDSWSKNQTIPTVVAKPHWARWPYGLYSWLSKTAVPASHASADVRNRPDDCRTLLPSASS